MVSKEVTAEQPEQGPLAGVRRVVDWLSLAFAAVAGVAVVLMAIHVAADVFSRNAFNSPIPGTIELITYLWMPVVVFLAIPYVEQKRAHISVTLMTDALSGSLRSISQILITVVSAFIFLVVLYLAFGSFTDSFSIRQTSSGALPVPIWIGKGVMLLGLIQTFLQMFVSSPKSTPKSGT